MKLYSTFSWVKVDDHPTILQRRLALKEKTYIQEEGRLHLESLEASCYNGFIGILSGVFIAAIFYFFEKYDLFLQWPILFTVLIIVLSLTTYLNSLYINFLPHSALLCLYSDLMSCRLVDFLFSPIWRALHLRNFVSLFIPTSFLSFSFFFWQLFTAISNPVNGLFLSFEYIWKFFIVRFTEYFPQLLSTLTMLYLLIVVISTIVVIFNFERRIDTTITISNRFYSVFFIFICLVMIPLFMIILIYNSIGKRMGVEIAQCVPFFLIITIFIFYPSLRYLVMKIRFDWLIKIVYKRYIIDIFYLYASDFNVSAEEYKINEKLENLFKEFEERREIGYSKDLVETMVSKNRDVGRSNRIIWYLTGILVIVVIFFTDIGYKRIASLEVTIKDLPNHEVIQNYIRNKKPYFVQMTGDICVLFLRSKNYIKIDSKSATMYIPEIHPYCLSDDNQIWYVDKYHEKSPSLWDYRWQDKDIAYKIVRNSQEEEDGLAEIALVKSFEPTFLFVEDRIIWLWGENKLKEFGPNRVLTLENDGTFIAEFGVPDLGIRNKTFVKNRRLYVINTDNDNQFIPTDKIISFDIWGKERIEVEVNNLSIYDFWITDSNDIYLYVQEKKKDFYFMMFREGRLSKRFDLSDLGIGVKSQHVWNPDKAVPLLSEKGEFGFINSETGQIYFVDVNEKILRLGDYWIERLKSLCNWIDKRM